MMQYYAFAKFVAKLNWASKQVVRNLGEAKVVYLKIDKARLKFESSILKEVSSLSDKKQIRYIDSLLQDLSWNRKYYIDVPYWVEKGDNLTKENLLGERAVSDIKRICGFTTIELLNFNDEQLADAGARVREYYKNYDYLFWLLLQHIESESADAGEVEEFQREKLLSILISEVFYTAHEQIRDYFEKIAGEKESIKRILNHRKMQIEMIEYRMRQRAEENPETDNRMPHLKVADWLFGDDQIKNVHISGLDDLADESVEINEPEKGSLLKWQKTRGGVADMAELLYRLERGGFLNLKEYMSTGNSSELCRRICYVFQFEGKDPIGNLKAYLSKLEGSFGPGPVQLEDLKPIGRSKGGMMEGVMPSED